MTYIAPKIALAFFMTCVIARGELKADQLALVVNKNVRESRSIADFYVKARQLPADRIIELDLPNVDEMSFEQYERIVVPGVRAFLEDHHLRDQVKSLVTIYGIPLKIHGRVPTSTDIAEQAELKTSLVAAEVALLDIADAAEAMAKREDPAFAPLTRERTSGSMDGSMKRLDNAGRSLSVAIQKTADPTARQAKLNEVESIFQKLRRPLRVSGSSTAPAASQPVEVTQEQINGWLAHRDEPAARRQLRDALREKSLMDYAQTINAQMEYLNAADTDAAFDSELALLWWPNYSREKFLPNPLNYNYLKSRTPPVLMTMRLDAPQPQMVQDLIATSIEVERKGLEGGIVVDGGGSGALDPQHKNPGVTQFDRQFDSLADLVREKTRVVLTFDKNTSVLPKGSAKDVAMYTGWYSVGHYSPCCTFSRGAIGYHVASYEMTSLHDNGNAGWCRGLLNDGVVATLGPVSEPYLGAFPLPDDFFALLMTGEMTLAEVYWHTTPLVSWKMTMVGDPLYQPYKAHPALRMADIPSRLLPLVQGG